MSQAEDVIRRNSRSFSLAARLLPKRFRDDVTSLYAWCRTVDDAVDHAASPEEAAATLADLRTDIDRVTAGQNPKLPATHWIASLIQFGNVDPAHAIDLLEGMQMDAQGFRVRTDGDLRRYCYHAAGSVGLMMSRLMGVRDPAAKHHAIALGQAMQMTNIARDVLEDAHRGRSYLPRVANPLSAAPDDVEREVRRLLDLAEQEYNVAIVGIDYLPTFCRPAIRVALAVYREIGREIQRQGYPILDRRVVVPRWRLFMVAVKASLSVNPFRRLKRASPMQETELSTPNVRSSSLSQARASVCLGLSLTAVMAAVLFVLVYVNPKDASYGLLPLVYAAVSILFAIVMQRLSVRFETAAE